MYPKPFDYVMPATLDEAIQKLQQDKAMALAGGSGLVPAMSLGRAAPALLVDLRQLADLAGLAPRPEGGWRIGALTTYATLATSQTLQENYPALAEAIQGLSDPAVRNRATLGGALAEAHPASDVAAAVLALKATLQVRGPAGARAIPAAEFFTGPGQTALKAAEIIYAVDLPAAGKASAYEKFKNPASGYALCGVAVCLEKAGGKIVGAQVALTGAADYPQRLADVEAALVGQVPTAARVSVAAAQIGAARLNFVTDLAASAAYRAHLAEVLVKRALARVA
jgi:aerobic carbon-monoxide dehydrogenase medium subunit